MTDLPPGEWSAILVGDQWPDGHDIAVLGLGRDKRAAVRTSYLAFADLLLNTQRGPLAEQAGRTVDDIRHSFIRDENLARGVAALNGVKEDAYRTAYDSMQSLRNDLTAIAEEGNKEIKQVESSQFLTAAKTAKIADIIQRCKSLSAVAAAKYAGNVLDAIQSILDLQAMGQSARQFAQDHGVDLERMFRAHSGQGELERQIRDHLERSSPLGVAPGFSASLDQPPDLHALGAPPRSAAQLGVTTGFSAANESLSPTQRSQTSRLGASTQMGVSAGFANAAPPLVSRSLPTNALISVSPPVTQGPPNECTSSTPAISARGPSSTGLGIAAPSPPTPTISPTELAQSFNKGMESGAPLSAAAHATPSVPITSTEPQISHAAQTIPSAAANSQAHVPVVDSPPPVHHTPPAEAPPTPIVAAPQPISPLATPQAVGPLPTYGSDLRPPVTTSITPPPPSAPLPPSATPSSAPVTPSAGQSPTNQPAVVRQTTPASTPPPPSAHGTQAVAATATGAAVGAASDDAAARKRLQRLVNTVARQQPRLAWAAGDRADKTTLLVTDLASGWIPPGINLPAAVTLLPPARRRGNLEALLGDAAVTACYTPIHLLPDDAEPNPTSPRPRSVPDVSDLGWELSQATQWRDGLPRLAHTLAKAASAGTGVLDSEIDLLREHLATTSKCVLDSYPDHVDTHQVGNWQLLAAIDALVGGDRATANYHLAWFLQTQI